MVELVPVCLAVMVSVGNAPPTGPDVPSLGLHPSQVEEIVDRLADVLSQRGRGAFALLDRWRAAGNGRDPDIFVIDLRGGILFGPPRSLAIGCGDRFVDACHHVAERFGCGWVDGPASGDATWSYVRETRVDGVEAFVGVHVPVNRNGIPSTAALAR